MENLGKKRMSVKIGLLTIAAAIIIGGSSAVSAYGKEKTVFETPFESSTIPACSSEEVAISGVARFVFTEKTDKDGNLRQEATMSYHAHAEGITTGTKYIVHEKEVITIQQEAGDTTFGSVIKGKFNGQGSEPNTHIRIHLVTVVHENGDVETIVDDVDVKCN